MLVKAAGVAATVLLCTAVQAHGSWTQPPDLLSPPGQNAASADVAIGPDGVATAVWIRSDGTNNIVQASRYAGGAWSPPVALSQAGRNAFEPRVAAGSDGVVTAVWRRENPAGHWIIQARRFLSGAWGSTADLSQTNRSAFNPRVAVGPGSVPVVVWNRSDGTNSRIQASRFAGSQWSAPPEDISDVGGDAFEPDVAVGPDGVAVAVWRRNDGARDIVQAARLVNGTWQSGDDLSDESLDAFGQTVAVGPDGVPIAAWTETDDFTTAALWVARFTQGNWGGRTALSPLNEPIAYEPRIATSPGGVAHVIWRGVDGADEVIQAARFDGSNWSPEPGPLSPSGRDAVNPDAATAPDGTPTVVWTLQAGNEPEDDIVQAARRGPSGWSAPVTLSPAGRGSVEPAVAVGPDGAAVAAWQGSDGTRSRIHASRFLVPPGTPTAVTAAAGTGQVTVSWTPPALTGGGALTYTATASPGGATCTATGVTCTIGGLTNGVTYTVSVVAANALGPGGTSAPSAPVTPTAAPGPGDGATPAPPAPAPFACTLPRRASTLRLPATVAQLGINQRIAIAAVRRLNTIAARLDGRPAPAARRAPQGRIRATTGQLRINQRISEAGYLRAKAIYDRLGGTGATPLRSVARTIIFNRAGVGTNQLTNIRTLDMLNCINRNLG